MLVDVALAPVVVLSAPARWVGRRVRRRRLFIDPLWGAGGDGPPFAGVREPRRPKPTPPSDAIELDVEA